MVRGSVVPSALLAAITALAACGSVTPDVPADAAVDAPSAPPDANQLGTREQPAVDCAELLQKAGPSSGVYWIKDPEGIGDPFEVYCEQELRGGGWAMVYNSVLRMDGTTLPFWNIAYLERFKRKGKAAPDENYYHSLLYLFGREYMDIIVDLDSKLIIAAVMKTDGIDRDTMRFAKPVLIEGNSLVFAGQFASGWSAPDKDLDTAEPASTDPKNNCAVSYSNVTQHYSACWAYNLGSDADAPHDDGGVGPHVNNAVLRDLALVLEQPADSTTHKYSRVKRIARFTRW